MPNCWNVICKTPIDIESDGSPPLYCSLCGVSVPLVMFSSITKTSKSCRSCGKLCRPRGDGQTPIFCSRCGCDELSTAFGGKFMRLNCIAALRTLSSDSSLTCVLMLAPLASLLEANVSMVTLCPGSAYINSTYYCFYYQIYSTQSLV